VLVSVANGRASLSVWTDSTHFLRVKLEEFIKECSSEALSFASKWN